MIVEPTVLVLGAGASMDFSFQSGKDLLTDVIRDTQSTTDTGKLLATLGFTGQQCDAFVTALKSSAAMSVDVFLADRRDFVDLGRAAIAAALIPKEYSESVFAIGQEFSWLYRLFDRLRSPSAERWVDNQLSIVTFNYDRVVEFFLHAALMNTFRLSSADAAALLVRTVPMVHVHGQLGQLPDFGNGPSRPFVQDRTAEMIRVAAAGIRIAHEGAEGDAQFV